MQIAGKEVAHIGTSHAGDQNGGPVTGRDGGKVFDLHAKIST
jgi:hypothetical protein